MGWGQAGQPHPLTLHKFRPGCGRGEWGCPGLQGLEKRGQGHRFQVKGLVEVGGIEHGQCQADGARERGEA